MNLKRIALFSVISGIGMAMTAAQAELPDYEEPDLLIRSGAGSAYQVPEGSSWVDSTPALSDNRIVGLEIGVVGNTNNAGMWQGDPDDGGIVSDADEGELWSNPGLNDDGVMVWRTAEGDPEGLLRYDPATGDTEFLTNAPTGASSWTAVQVNNGGVVGYRSGIGFSGNVWVTWDDEDGDVIHVAESGVDSDFDYAFVFTPSLNDNRDLAGKVDVDSFDNSQIVIADVESNVTVLAENTALDPDSPFDSFQNSVGFNNLGQVSFTTTLAVEGVQAIYVADADGWTEYAREGEDGLDELEFFSTALSDTGVVAFRGFNDSGDRAVWVSDGQTVQQLVTVGDEVETDQGTLLIGTPDGDAPEFGGNVSINSQGDVAFSTSLVDPDDPGFSYGRAAFLVRAGEVSGEPELALTKSADPMIFDTVGQEIEYSYLVENTGEVDLAGPVTVDDDQETVSCPEGDLDPGDSVTCTATREISEEDLDVGSVTNTATASADGTESNADSVTIVTPEIFEDRFEAEQD